MKEILRTCVCCRKKQDHRLMFRIVRKPEGNVVFDKSYKENGRGAYLCKNIECINKAKKSRVLDRQLECNIPVEIYDQLLLEIK